MLSSKVPKFCIDPEGDSVVARHLQHIYRELVFIGIEFESLVLGGSFGRGEGATQKSEFGPQPINDYDIFIISAKKPTLMQRRNLKALSQIIAGKIGVWHIDFISISFKQLACKDVSMLLYDLKFGGKVFAGNASILDAIPYQANGKLPDQELENLLINRSLTLLEAYPSAQDKNQNHTSRQLAKVVYALADARLNASGSYTTLYRDKEQELEKLGATDVTALKIFMQLSWAKKAWSYALPDTTHESALNRWESTRALLLEELTGILQRKLKTDHLSAEKIVQNWRESTSKTPHLLTQQLPKHRHEEAEKEIFAFLYFYPAMHFFEPLSLAIPVAKLQGSQNPKWEEVKRMLIQRWYR